MYHNILHWGTYHIENFTCVIKGLVHKDRLIYVHSMKNQAHILGKRSSLLRRNSFYKFRSLYGIGQRSWGNYKLAEHFEELPAIKSRKGKIKIFCIFLSRHHGSSLWLIYIGKVFVLSLHEIVDVFLRVKCASLPCYSVHFVAKKFCRDIKIGK
jgi:hypothetical protein